MAEYDENPMSPSRRQFANVVHAATQAKARARRERDLARAAEAAGKETKAAKHRRNAEIYDRHSDEILRRHEARG